MRRAAPLAAILCLAAALRFSGLAWGLRHEPHSDERDFVDRAVAMLKAGDLDHRWYQYPGLFLYLLGAAIAPLGAARWESPDAYLACRAVVSAFGVLNVGLLYVVASRLVGGTGAIAAALLLAVSPLDVQTAHQVRADIPMQTAGLLALLALRGIGVERKGDVRMGLVIGFGTALKFTGLLLVPMYVCARLLQPGSRWRGLAIAGSLTIAVALLCTPYALIHWRQYFGIGAPGTVVYNSALGGPATYYKANADPVRTLGFMLQGALFTLGPIAAALAAFGAWLRLRESWREWLPPLLHPLTTLAVVAPAGMMFQRHLLPATGVFYLFAATPIEALARRSRPLALGVALLAAWGPFHAAADYSWRMAQPSGQDKALDWIEANVRPGSRILETRPEARGGGLPGAVLGIDASRYEVVHLRSDEDRLGLRLAAPEMDLVITGPAGEARWAESLEPAFAAAGPLGNVVLQLKRPRPNARSSASVIELGAARISVSEAGASAAALHDGDLGSVWTTGAPMSGREWIQIVFERDLAVARLELLAGAQDKTRDSDPELHVLGSEDGREYEEVRAVSVRAPLARQNPAFGPLSQVLALARRPLRALRIEQRGVRPSAWSVAELSIFPASGDRTR